MANDILVKVGANITQFSKAMADARKDMENLNKKISGVTDVTSKVGGALTKGITVPALAAASALTGITLVKGYGRLVGIDTARAKLNALGHDAEGVEVIMNSALDSVRGTAYGLDEAATAAASAVAAGIEPGKELTKYLTLTGDAAAVAGSDFNEMASIFNKVQTAQRAYTGELNQLADRGIPVFQWLADEAGVTADVIRDMATDGEISAEMFRTAIENNIGGAAQTIGEQSFAAALRNIGSDLARIGANFLDAGGQAGGFFSTVKPLLTEFRGFLASIEPHAAELGRKFGEAFINIINKLKEMKSWYDSLNPVMQGFVKTMTIIGTIITLSAGPAMLLLGSAVKFLTVTVPGLIKIFKALAPVFTAVSKGVTVLRTALLALSGPVGWITAGSIALVTGVVAVVKWFSKSSKEAKRLNGETEKLGESVEQLSDGVDSSSKAYKDNQKEVTANAKANQDLAKKVQELSSKENKSASDKALLKSYVEELNKSVEDLNLAYDEEADALNMSSEKINDRLGLMKEQEKANVAQERLTEILKEQAEAEQKLKESNALRKEWNENLENGTVSSRDHRKAIEELDEQEKALKDTISQLGDEQVETEEQFTTSMEAIAEATRKSVESQVISYDKLDDTQAEVIDNMKARWQEYQDAATNMFDTLSDKITLTAGDMRKNLEENQRIISEWSENIATLAARGVDEGLLDTLREAGPESAGHVKALVEASDSELEALNDVFSQGAKKATSAFATSLGMDDSEMFDSLEHLITSTETSLRQQIKATNWSSLGLELPKGLAGGVDEGTQEAEKAARSMADKTAQATREAFQIRSPSRVYKEIGGYVTAGLADGITENTSDAISAIKRMFAVLAKESTSGLNGLSRVFKTQLSSIKQTLNTQFNAIGKHAMSGLKTGLDAGKNKVLSTAKGIANGVAQTMRSALRVKSPSRVTREIGEWVGIGLADGISDTVRQVTKASEVLADAAVPQVPKLSSIVGGDVNGYVNEVSARLNTEISGGQSDGVSNHYYERMLEGATFVVREEADIDRIAERLAQKVSDAKARKGIR